VNHSSTSMCTVTTLCSDGSRTLLVDWNLAAIGNPRIELIGWLPSLSVEGGPPPDQLTGPDDAPFSVITAGHFAARSPGNVWCRRARGSPCGYVRLRQTITIFPSGVRPLSPRSGRERRTADVVLAQFIVGPSGRVSSVLCATWRIWFQAK
jgi:hypothetical protein